MAEARKTLTDRLLDLWWGKVVVGVVLVVIGVSKFNQLGKLESGQAESLRLGRSTRVLYDLGGRGAVLGVPLVVGLGFIFWGVAQVLRRHALADAGRRRMDEHEEPSESGDDRPFWLRAFDEAYNDPILWRILFAVFGVIHIAIAVAVLHLIWSDPVEYANVVAILFGVVLGYVTLEWMARKLRCAEGPLVDWRARVTWIMIVGYSLALALAGSMAWNQAAGREESRRRAIIAQREKEELQRRMNTPEVQQANQMLRLREAARGQARERSGAE